MTERTALGEAILKHWREHCPRMVSDLERTGLLDGAVSEAQSRTGDLLHDLVSVQKMDYHSAWELAMREWALPSEEDLSLPENPPSQTSGSGKSSRSHKPYRRRGTSG